MEKELAKFNAEATNLMRDLKGISQTKKNLDKHEKDIRSQLLNLFEKYNIEKIDNEYVKITRVAGSESITVNVKKIEKIEPDFYEQLIKEYPKKNVRKSYIRITTK